MKAVVIIPARLASTRLPRKILREIAGRPMLQYVYEAAKRSNLVQDVIVATDSDEILAYCQKKGWTARITSDKHQSGTDRVIEVARVLIKEGREVDVFVNVQGDEPLAHPEHVEALLKPMRNPEVMVTSVMTAAPQEDIVNPNAVKVVTNQQGRALYFSRSTIPFDRDNAGGHRYMKHLGFYAYRMAALERFRSWPESSLERSERLEQLRFLENGTDIYLTETQHDTIGVDTEADLKRVEGILRKEIESYPQG